MKQSKLLIRNTIINYSRLASIVILTLVTHRLLLQNLGFTQYGILASLNSIGMFGAMLGTAMLSAAHRHLAFELGRGSDSEFGNVVQACLASFLGLSAAFALIAWVIRPWLFSSLGIPQSSVLPYYFSIGYIVGLLLAGPATAVFVANQRFGVIAAMQVFLAIVMLIAAIAIGQDTVNGLTVYTGAICFSQAFITIVAVFASYRLLARQETKRAGLRLREIGELMRFFLWNSFCHAATYLRLHGALLATFSVFGAVIAAGYEVANKVSNLQRQAGYSVAQATQPAIATAGGRSADGEVNALALASSKFACLAAMFVTIPVLVDAELVLFCWLGEYPEHAPIFVRLLGVTATLAFIADGHALASVAKGNIALPSMLSTVCQVLVVSAVIAYVLWANSPEIWLIPAGGLVAVVFVAGLHVLVLGRRLDIAAASWFFRVLTPVALVAGFSMAIGFLTRDLFENAWLSLLSLVSFTSLAIGVSAWFLALSPEERITFRHALSLPAQASIGAQPGAPPEKQQAPKVQLGTGPEDRKT